MFNQWLFGHSGCCLGFQAAAVPSGRWLLYGHPLSTSMSNRFRLPSLCPLVRLLFHCCLAVGSAISVVGSLGRLCPAVMCLCTYRKSIQPLSGGCCSDVAVVRPPLHLITISIRSGGCWSATTLTVGMWPPSSDRRRGSITVPTVRPIAVVVWRFFFQPIWPLLFR